jgi:hypothetical protein
MMEETWAKCYLLCTRRCRRITSASCSKLKTTEGVHQFKYSNQVAILVKKYRGSLSGEHGDGIVREISPFMIGEKNYELLKRVKLTFDQIQF